MAELEIRDKCRTPLKRPCSTTYGIPPYLSAQRRRSRANSMFIVSLDDGEAIGVPQIAIIVVRSERLSINYAILIVNYSRQPLS
ncbi:hypothetical protein AB6A40_007207 [Gnathostoma spinigerum]|uniref:Uncharacterized protein n=1 Tax=Gnathostoma spinigerum TaxID=75299 RepID=A0ABD6EKJ2_9BILA